MKRVLCLDLGRKLGIVYNFFDKKTKSEAISYDTIHLGKKGDFGSALSQLEEILYEHVNKVDEIHYEKVQRHIGTMAAHAYGAYQGQVLKVAHELKIPVFGWPVGVIKKSFTGNGRASKDDMIKEAIKRGHKDVKDDNSADALAIYYLAISQITS